MAAWGYEFLLSFRAESIFLRYFQHVISAREDKICIRARHVISSISVGYYITLNTPVCDYTIYLPTGMAK